MDSKILLIGDAILDEYFTGTCNRVSPEAPVPLVELENHTFSLGGALNVASALDSLQCKVDYIGVVGDDFYGKDIIRLLKSKNNINPHIITERNRTTPVKIRVIANNQHIVRVDREDVEDIDISTEEKIIDILDSLPISNYKVIIISDYGKGLIHENLIEYLNKKRSDSSVLIVDPNKDGYFERYEGIDILTPNIKELTTFAKTHNHPTKRIKGMVDEAFLATIAKYIFVTAGSEGIYLYSYDGKYGHFQHKAEAVYDVTGAGDVFVAIFSYLTSKGYDINTACKVANKIATKSVSYVGTYLPTLEDVECIDCLRCSGNCKKKGE